MRWRHYLFDVCRALGGTLCTLILWLSWVLMAGLAILLLVALLGRNLAVPEFILSKLELELRRHQLSVRSASASFDPTGKIILENFEVLGGPGAVPVFTGRAAYVNLDLWKLAVGIVEAEAIELVNGRVICPAILSISGSAENLLEKIHARLERDDGRWEIRFLTGKWQDVRWAVEGPLLEPRVPILPPRRVPTTPDRPRWAPWLRRVSEWSIYRETVGAADLIVRTDGSNLILDELQIDFKLPGGRWIDGWEHREITGSLRADLADDPPYRIHVRAETPGFHMMDGPGWTGVSVAVDVPLSEWALPDLLLGSFVSRTHFGDLAPADFGGEFSLDMRNSGSIAVAGAWNHSPFEVRAQTAEAFRPASADVRLQLSRTALEEIIGRIPGPLSEYHTPIDPLRIEAELTFGPGGGLTAASGRIEVDEWIAREVHLQRAAGYFSWAPGWIEVDDIVLHSGLNTARGSYSGNLDTLDFRFLLEGNLYPHDISPWFRPWWAEFWSNFAFPRRGVDADIEITGRWGYPHLTRVFTHATAVDGFIRDMPYNHFVTRIFVRPGYYHVLDFEGGAGEGFAGGTFIQEVDLSRRIPTRLRFDVESTLDPVKAAIGIFGEAGESVMRGYTFTESPGLRLHGETGLRDNSPYQDVHVEAIANAPFLFHGVSVDRAAVKARIENDVVSIDPLDFGLAGGAASGKAVVSGPPEEREISYSVKLDEADLARAVALFPRDNRNAGASTPDAGLSGKLAIEIDASGPLHDWAGGAGRGTALITEAELGQIHMLGLLSQLLRDTLLGFTSMRLTDVRTDFELVDRHFNFPDLRVTGPTAAIHARGWYNIDERNMNFLSRVFPFRESSFPVFGLVGLVLSPLSTVLEVRLTGTPDDPQWRFSMGASTPRPVVPDERSDEAPAPVLEPPEFPDDQDAPWPFETPPPAP